MACVGVVAHKMVTNMDVPAALVVDGVLGQRNGSSVVVEQGERHFAGMYALGEADVDVIFLAQRSKLLYAKVLYYYYYYDYYYYYYYY